MHPTGDGRYLRASVPLCWPTFRTARSTTYLSRICYPGIAPRGRASLLVQQPESYLVERARSLLETETMLSSVGTLMLAREPFVREQFRVLLRTDFSSLLRRRRAKLAWPVRFRALKS